MQSVVKALISGFVGQYESMSIHHLQCALMLRTSIVYLETFPKPKAGDALAPYDISRLKAWWRYVTSQKVDPAQKFSKISSSLANTDHIPFITENKTLLVVIPAIEDVNISMLNDILMLFA